MFTVLLRNLIIIPNIVISSNQMKYVSLGLHTNKLSQELHYHSFAVKLDRCVGSYDTVMDLSNKECVPNNIDNLNISLFSIITRINESRTVTKHIKCKCKVKFV